MAGAASASPLAQHRARRSADARRQSINHTRVYSGHGFVNTGAAADPPTELTRGGPAGRRGHDEGALFRMIDRDYLAQQTGGDAALQRDVLVLFVDQVQDLCRRIEGGSNFSGHADLVLALHRLRGAAAAVGARDLAAALARAEDGAAVDALRAVARLPEILQRTLVAVEDLIAALPLRGLAKGSETN